MLKRAVVLVACEEGELDGVVRQVRRGRGERLVVLVPDYNPDKGRLVIDAGADVVLPRGASVDPILARLEPVLLRRLRGPRLH